jgi:NAD(P)-dependent dehydrogenase (short-subunit alcohol dehydrogenase family)/pimeloyl-ACP methyl ester carboxylesterase
MSDIRRVNSPDGLQLAVFEQGDPSAPTVVCIHGYPDNAAVWIPVAEQLAERFHVVRYDVRGAGESDKPSSRDAYLLDTLQDDFTAVIDAVSPDSAVHLLAHDWGSIQGWHFVTSEKLAGRIGSFTSISGPSLDHVGRWLRGNFTHRPAAVLRQLAHSGYLGLFQLPAIPEAACRSGLLDRVLARSGRNRDSRRQVADLTNGLNLYRANLRNRRGGPAADRRTDIPVQVIAPTQDSFVTPPLQLESPRPYATQLYGRTVVGGHWVLVSRPDVIARAAADLIDQVETGVESPDLNRAALAAKRRGKFAGQLVLVTGAGSGIGRETAYAFAQQGADLVLADIDDAAAEETADITRMYGVDARAYHLDVGDADAWEEFAQQISAKHGTPDVLVNNAGIGMAGPFLSTSRSDWTRIIDINLGSVIHGSRIFANQMVDRGVGGRIVNIASAAAYSPSRTYPAYATTKAAVLMLSECLTAELGREGITVTAICPGFINTNISATTTYVGIEAREEAAKQARAVKSYGRRNYSAQRAAKQILKIVASNKPVGYITAEALGFLALDRYLPFAQRAIAKVDLTEL